MVGLDAAAATRRTAKLEQEEAVCKVGKMHFGFGLDLFTA